MNDADALYSNEQIILVACVGIGLTLHCIPQEVVEGRGKTIAAFLHIHWKMSALPLVVVKVNVEDVIHDLSRKAISKIGD